MVKPQDTWNEANPSPLLWLRCAGWWSHHPWWQGFWQEPIFGGYTLLSLEEEKVDRNPKWWWSRNGRPLADAHCQGSLPSQWWNYWFQKHFWLSMDLWLEWFILGRTTTISSFWTTPQSSCRFGADRGGSFCCVPGRLLFRTWKALRKYARLQYHVIVSKSRTCFGYLFSSIYTGWWPYFTDF